MTCWAVLGVSVSFLLVPQLLGGIWILELKQEGRGLKGIGFWITELDPPSVSDPVPFPESELTMLGVFLMGDWFMTLTSSSDSSDLSNGAS